MNNNNYQNQKQKTVAATLRAGAPLMNAEENFTPSVDEVARRAYFCYVNEGSQPGRDVQHWLAAEAELIKERDLTRTHSFHNHT